MSKLGLLHIITGLGMGGAEKVVFDLCRLTDTSKFDIHVIGLDESKDRLEDFLQSNISCTVYNMDKSLSSFLKHLRKTSGEIKYKNIKIIHAHMFHGLIFCLCLKILNPRLKLIYTSHTANVGSRFRKFMIRITKSLRSADIVFSDHMKDVIYKDPVHIIPNGIETGQYNPSADKEDIFTFISVGRLVPLKNHITIINAANELRKKGLNDFQILMVGEGELKTELQNMIKELDLENHIQLLGLRKDIPNLLSKCHCFLLSSKWEGLPISLLEAGASGLCVISTPVGSIPKVIDQSNGYLSTEDAFTSNMELVLNDHKMAQSKGMALLGTIKEKYELKRISELHEELYQKSIANEN